MSALTDILYSMARQRGRNISFTYPTNEDAFVFEIAPGNGPVKVTGLEVVQAKSVEELATRKLTEAGAL